MYKYINHTSVVFEEMVKSYDKAKKIVEKEGHFKQYIRAVAELEDYVVEVTVRKIWLFLLIP